MDVINIANVRRTTILRFIALAAVFSSVINENNEVIGQLRFPSAQFQPSARIQIVYEYEITKSVGNLHPGLVQSTLSRDGKLALINDPLGEKTLLVDTDTLEVTDLKIKNPDFAAWFDSESDYVYTVGFEKKIDVIAERFSPATGEYQHLCCYANIEALKQGTVLWESNNPYSTVWWIPGNENRIRLLLTKLDGVASPKSCTLIVENAKGQTVASHSVQGAIVGVDGDESAIRVFHVVGYRGGKGTLHSTNLSANGEECHRPKTIGPYALPLRWNVLDTNAGTRPFRLRGLRSGDINHYLTNLGPNTSYWQYQDYENAGIKLMEFLGPGRAFNMQRLACLNRSASSLDSSAFEVFTHVGGGPPSALWRRPAFLINHNGEFVEMPCPLIYDAVLNDSKSVIIGKKFTNNPNKDTICIMTIEKPKAP